MELRQYGRIIWKRGWIIALLTLATAIASLAFSFRAAAPAYVANVRLAISIVPSQPSTDFFTYDSYYAWLSSEYLADDFSELVASEAFARAVRAELGDPAAAIASIQKGGRAERAHRVLSFSVVGPEPGLVQRTAEAAARVMEERGSEFFAQLAYQNVAVRVLDTPAATLQQSGARIALDVGVRATLGFLVGLAIVLLLEYLDTSVRDRADAERLLGLPVLGEIPPEK